MLLKKIFGTLRLWGRTLKMFKNGHKYRQTICHSKELVEISRMTSKTCEVRNGTSSKWSKRTRIKMVKKKLIVGKLIVDKLMEKL